MCLGLDEQFPAQLTPGEGVPDGRPSMDGRGALATLNAKASATPESERSKQMGHIQTISNHMQ